MKEMGTRGVPKVIRSDVYTVFLELFIFSLDSTEGVIECLAPHISCLLL